MEKEFSIELRIVGARIRKARKRLQLTQEAAAERTNLTGQYWSLIETGRYRGSIQTYMQITSALGITLNDIFYDDTDFLHIQPPKGVADMLSDLTGYETEVLLRTLTGLRKALIESRNLL